MRVLLVLPGGLSSKEAGAFIPALAALTSRIAAHHETTAFVLAQDPEPREYSFRGARVVSLGAPLDLACGGRTFLTKLAQFRRALARHGPFDVVHAFWANTSGLLAALSIPETTPFVVSLAGGEFAACPEISYGQETTLAGRTRVRWALRRADAITAASGFIEHMAGRRGWSVRRIPLGVDAGLSTPLPAIRSRPPYSILSLASLNLVKGPFVLLDAFGILLKTGLDVTLTLAGEDALDGRVERHAKAGGLTSRTLFLGRVPPGQAGALLKRADVLAVSSFHEAGPVAAVEAAAAGVPIAGTAVGHLADWAGGLCEAVPPGDPARLAHAIGRLLASPSRRLELRKRGRAWAAVHDADRTATEFLAVYESLLKT